MRSPVLCTGTCAVFLATLALSAAPAQNTPRAAEFLAAGDQAWISSRYDDALRAYSEVLRRDSTAAHALFRVATLLSWRNDLESSTKLFRKYLTVSPGDADGRVALARVLAWRGDFRQSLAECDSVLAENPENRDAALLVAQTTAWSGHLDAAAKHYDRWLARHPDDAEAWNGIAQVWRWAGRADRARAALRHALAADPTNATAIAQLQWAEVALAPSVEPGITSTDDSDHNRTLTYLLRAGVAAPWSARVQTDVSLRTADIGIAHGTSATARASSSWSPLGGTWTMRGQLGVAQLDGNDGGGSHRAHTEPLAAGRITGRLGSRASLGIGVVHEPFDETAALIYSGIAATTLDGGTEIALRPRLSVSAEGSWTRLTGGASPNSRVSGSGALRWSVAQALSLGAGVRTYDYDHAAADGYFTPRQYLLAEGTAHLHLGGELGWGFDSELGLGQQRIRAFDLSSASRFAQRYSVVVAYRPAPGLEWNLGSTFANVASPTTISSRDYRAYRLSLSGRLRL